MIKLIGTLFDIMYNIYKGTEGFEFKETKEEIKGFTISVTSRNL